MEDFMLPARSLDAVRLADSLLKRSSAFPNAWNLRYCVLNGNALYVYSSVDDAKPRRVICIDGASVTADTSKYKAHPFAFSITTRSGRTFSFEPGMPAVGSVAGGAEAAATGAYRDKWIKALGNAQYRTMFERTKAAVAFMDEVKGEVAQYRAALEGLPLPSPLPPAGTPVSDDPAIVARYSQLRDTLTSADIIAVVRAMRADVMILHASRAQLEAELAARPMMAAAPSARDNSGELSRLQGENDDLKRSVARLTHDLNAERAVARHGAVAAAEHSEEDMKLLTQLRSHVESLTEQLEAERREHTKDLERLAAAMSDVARATAAAAPAAGAPRHRSPAAGGEPPRPRSPAAAGGNGSDKVFRSTGSALSMKSAASSNSLQTPATPSADGKRPPTGGAAGMNRVSSFHPSALVRATSGGHSSVMSGADGSGGHKDADSSVISGGIGSSAIVAPSVIGARPAAAPAPAPAPSMPALDTSAAGSRAVDSTALEDMYAHEWAPHLIEAQRLEREGVFADAEQQFAAVLDAKRERLGDDDASVAASHRDLARVLALEQKYDVAEEHYMRAVDLFGRLLGEAHPNTACALTDLAAVLREQSKFGDAEAYAERAVKSLKAGVGADDVSTATALYNLAGLAKRQGKLPEAEAAYAEALSIFRKKLGEGQGETADTLYQMGCLYRKRGNYMRAGTFFSQAADSYAKTYGASDKRVAEATKRAHDMAQKIAAGGTERPRRAPKA